MIVNYSCSGLVKLRLILPQTPAKLAFCQSLVFRRVILLVILSNGSPLSANQPVNHFPDLCGASYGITNTIIRSMSDIFTKNGSN